MTESEIWRFIPGFSKNYMVSNLGKVKSLHRVIMRSDGKPHTVRERILKSTQDEWGYPQVRLDSRTIKVHRLVALAFLGERPVSYEIRHLDGDPTNNRLENLKYGTHSQNVLDEYRYRGYVRKDQKLSPGHAEEIRQLLASGVRSCDIAAQYGVSKQTICDIRHSRLYRQEENL